MSFSITLAYKFFKDEGINDVPGYLNNMTNKRTFTFTPNILKENPLSGVFTQTYGKSSITLPITKMDTIRRYFLMLSNGEYEILRLQFGEMNEVFDISDMDHDSITDLINNFLDIFEETSYFYFY